MKKQIRYCVFGLAIYLLLNIIAMGVTPSVQPFQEKSDVSYLCSQEDAVQNAIHLIYINSNPLRNATTVDAQFHCFRNNSRFLADAGYRYKPQSSTLHRKALHSPYLHPDNIIYYVYTLEEIVI